MERQGRVLIVDDNVMCIDILRRVLCRDFKLKIAASGEECLEKLPKFQPHLVLLDIMMPGMDGYETCRQIKFGSLGGFTQVILVSCKEMTVDRLRGYDALADDYIVKPFDPDELLAKVRSHFRIRDMQTDAAEPNAAEAFNRRMSLIAQMSKRTSKRLVSIDKKAAAGVAISVLPVAK